MNGLLVRIGTIGMLALPWVALPSLAQADEGWPRTIETERGAVTLYQPQAEGFDGSVLEARAAVSVTPAGEGSAPVFGAVWMRARVDTDRDERLVTVRSVEVPQTRFPDASEEQQQQLGSFLAAEMSRWELTLSLDRLVADLELEDPTFTTEGLRHQPPRILLAKQPAVLVQIDGEPILEPVEATGLQRVANTPFPILHDASTGLWYLSGGEGLWYTARDVLGPWQATDEVPAFVSKLVDPADAPAARPTGAQGSGPAGARGAATTSGEGVVPAPGEEQPPVVLVATEPSELIVCAGEPSWSPVEGMELLYLDNSDSDVFLDIAGQRYYVLLSGRWYRAAAVEGELAWEHVPNDELPRAFAEIEPDSVNGAVLTHVSGTEQAREAVLDSIIPQTAAVKRDDASLQVEYDGQPEFVEVEDLTSVSYAVNTPAAVFRVGSSYYCCDQGVWYVATSPTGPWGVATEVPAVLYDLPPSNPHYNVVYVRVYDVTPEVVYVGYTPGYLGCYYYHGCVVYGSGWYYRPWYRSYYYPRCWTWGLRVTYNPWTGWGVGIGFSNGWFSFGVGTWGGGYRYAGAWFGPAGYRPCPRPYVGVGYRKTNIHIDNSVNINVGDRGRPGARPGTLPADRGNLYDRERNRDRLAERPATSDRRRPEVADRRNDVLTDRDGNVYRRDEGGGWQQRDRGEWKPAEGLDRSRPDAGGRPQTRPEREPGTRPAPGGDRPSQGGARPAPRPSQPVPRTRPPSSGGATRPQLERDSRQRNRGSQRSQGFGGSPRSGGARPAPRGGGRGRG